MTHLQKHVALSLVSAHIYWLIFFLIDKSIKHKILLHPDFDWRDSGQISLTMAIISLFLVINLYPFVFPILTGSFTRIYYGFEDFLESIKIQTFENNNPIQSQLEKISKIRQEYNLINSSDELFNTQGENILDNSQIQENLEILFETLKEYASELTPIKPWQRLDNFEQETLGSWYASYSAIICGLGFSFKYTYWWVVFYINMYLTKKFSQGYKYVLLVESYDQNIFNFDILDQEYLAKTRSEFEERGESLPIIGQDFLQATQELFPDLHWYITTFCANKVASFQKAKQLA